jgi:hypothetical protein
VENFKEFKNLIHNEFKITKDDVLGMMREVIREEVKNVFEHKAPQIDEMIENYVQHLVRQGLGDGGRHGQGFKERVSSLLSDAVGAFIANKLDITLGVEGQEVPLSKGEKSGFRVVGSRVSFDKGGDGQ